MANISRGGLYLAIGLFLLSASWALATPRPFAQPFTPQNGVGASQMQVGGTAKQPVLLTADQLGYDRANSLVIAEGHVEVVQGDTIVLADRISYHQNTNEVIASGNVSLRQATGDVVFADNVRLKNNLQAGIIHNFRARMKDNSLFAAREARKMNESVTELDYAVYSPCKVCDGKNPLWQFKAKSVRVDEKEEKVTYDDARLEIKGVPVLWTPYFSHATPGASPKSGFLTPEWRTSRELGTTVSTPYYYSIAPNMDYTITPRINTSEAPMLDNDFRYMNEQGAMRLRASITNPQRRDSGTGARLSGRELRGHIDANGRFQATPEWDWGFNIRRATDDTYMRRYNISPDDLLTTRLFVEGIEGRSFASVQGLAFQRLTNEANPASSPLVLPLANYWWQGDPGWMGSRYEISANTMMLTRDVGPQSRRFTMSGGWSVPYITPDGQIFKASARLRGDAYSVADVLQPDGTMYDGFTGRVIPEVELGWSYPLINEYEPGKSLLLEPVVSFVASPPQSDSNKIPNEDSQVLEYNDTNVFDASHYPGYDLVETGARANYGMRGIWQFSEEDDFNFLIGQNFRAGSEDTFPFSNDPDENFSDYIARMGLRMGDWLDTHYRVRFDQAAISARRQEFNTILTLDPVLLQVDYLNLNADPFLGDRQEIFGYGTLALDENWSLMAGARRDLENSKMINALGGFQYQDECFTLFANIARNFIIDRDVQPGTSFVLRLQLKNLE